MTTIYDYADVLRALADKKALQIYNNGDWNDITPATALRHISDCIYIPELIRVKPKTIMINGVKCECRVPQNDQPTPFSISIGLNVDRAAPKTAPPRFYFSNYEAAARAHSALLSFFVEA